LERISSFCCKLCMDTDELIMELFMAGSFAS
jgi:hypothetical protein